MWCAQKKYLFKKKTVSIDFWLSLRHTLSMQWMDWFICFICPSLSRSHALSFLLSHQALQQLGMFQSSLPHRPLGRAQSSPAGTVNPNKHFFTTGQFLCLCVCMYVRACVYACVILCYITANLKCVGHLYPCCLATFSWLSDNCSFGQSKLTGIYTYIISFYIKTHLQAQVKGFLLNYLFMLCCFFQSIKCSHKKKPEWNHTKS